MRKKEGDTQPQDTHTPEVRQLAENIKAWREILVHMDRIVNWERPRLLLGIEGGIALGFILIWLLKPSLLTSFALVGLVCTALDFTVPIMAPRMFESSTWTPYEEEHFLSICENLSALSSSVVETVTWLQDLRLSRPTFYFTLMAVFFTILAFVGDKFNNFILSYLFVSISLITPGLVKYGVLTRLYNQIKKVVEKKTGPKNNRRG